MRYRVKFYKHGKLCRCTVGKFNGYDRAEYYLKRVLKFKSIRPDVNYCTFEKHEIRAAIIGINGIPF